MLHPLLFIVVVIVKLIDVMLVVVVVTIVVWVVVTVIPVYLTQDCNRIRYCGKYSGIVE